MMNLLARKNSSLYYERKLILMDKCEKVIIRRPVSEEAIAKANESLEAINKTCALLILGESCGLEESATAKDMKFTMGALLDLTATLAGFRNSYDMTDYLKIYGKL